MSLDIYVSGKCLFFYLFKQWINPEEEHWDILLECSKLLMEGLSQELLTFNQRGDK